MLRNSGTNFFLIDGYVFSPETASSELEQAGDSIVSALEREAQRAGAFIRSNLCSFPMITTASGTYGKERSKILISPDSVRVTTALACSFNDPEAPALG